MKPSTSVLVERSLPVSNHSVFDAPTARALILGFAYYPEELPAHCEQLAAIPIADKGTARMRDRVSRLGTLSSGTLPSGGRGAGSPAPS